MKVMEFFLNLGKSLTEGSNVSKNLMLIKIRFENMKLGIYMVVEQVIFYSNLLKFGGLGGLSPC